jgi:YHS domain-containing protein
VETGWRLADRVEIVRGLMPGERIVISGTFLIDSESRMKAAAQGVFGDAVEDPVCGMQVDQQRAAAEGHAVTRGGSTYYFCSDDCKHQFEKDPARYLKHAPAAPEARRETVGQRPRPATPVAPPPATPAVAAPKAAAPAGMGAARSRDESTSQRYVSTDKAIDPICGMEVVREEAVTYGRMMQRDGQTYYFCSDACRKTFAAQKARNAQ